MTAAITAAGAEGEHGLRAAGSEGASALLPAAAAPSTQDALDLLHADHQRIAAMLADCERLVASGAASAADRSGMVSRLGALLIAHAQMEQQLFYPALGLDAQQLELAIAEHAAVEAVLQRLSEPDAASDAYSACIAELALQVREHVQKEEAELFALARSAGLDLPALGTRMALRRGELLGDQGID